MIEIPRELIIKVAQGDQDSFAAMYRSLSGMVYNVALRMLGNTEDAKEVTQDVFLAIHGKIKDFRFESSLSTWAYRITVNLCINFLRRHAPDRTRRVEYDESALHGSVQGDIKERIDREHSDAVIEEMLRAINPQQRACVVLRGIEGLSYQQIAEVMKININTVRTRLRRAREKMLRLRKKATDESV
jgi:RNA polymerase sigma-70 factor, ECF subfamily